MEKCQRSNCRKNYLAHLRGLGHSFQGYASWETIDAAVARIESEA